MLWDVASALVRSIAFLSRLCSDCSSIAHDVRSAYDSDVAPVLSLLGSAKDALTKVKGAADSAKDLKDKLFLANRDECKEIAERVNMISATIDELRKQYDEAKPATAAAKSKAVSSRSDSSDSHSSAAASSVSLRPAAFSSAAAGPPLPADLSAHLSALTAALTAVTTLISAQLLPASEKSWFARHKWILQQARKRDEVRAQFASHAAKISNAMAGLGFALQVQTNGTLMQMAAKTADTALNRSDLLAFQQMYADEIEAERASWTAAQREEIAVGFNGLLLQLEESAQKQVEAMNAGFDAAAQVVHGGFVATISKLDAQSAQLSGIHRKLDESARLSDTAHARLHSIDKAVHDGRAATEQKLDSTAAKLDLAAHSIEQLKAMVEAMQLQQASAAKPAAPASPSAVLSHQWKYSFLELSIVDLQIDFDDDSRCIGEGAVGEVWIGEWTPNLLSSEGGDSVGSSVALSSPQHGKPLPVAFKLLKLPRGTSESRRLELVRQLKREGSLLWLLNGHPSAVQLYGAVTVGKKIGLAFELCNAGTLQSHLYTIETDSYKRVTGPAALTPVQQLSAVSSLLQAIGFAHAKGVVHRDVKSQNVLVHDFNRSSDSVAAASEAASSQSAASSSSSASSASPPLLSFKLSDFGSARALGQFAGLSAFTSTMVGVAQCGGTLRWTPPELLSAQWHKLSAADRRSAENSFAVDIYALGLVIGEIFLQQPPFAVLGQQCKDLNLRDAMVDPHSAPFEWREVEAIAPKLAALIKACCHRNPHKRPSIAELTYALWPETMQQILMRSQPSPSSQAISALVSPSPPVTSPVVVSAPSPVPLSDAVRSRIQSALSVLGQPSAGPRSLEKACTELSAVLLDANHQLIDSACTFVVQSGGIALLVSTVSRLNDGPSLLTPAARALARLSMSDKGARMMLKIPGLIESMLSAAENFPLEADLVSSVCRTLGNLCSVDARQTPMPRTLPMLLRSLKDHSANPTVVASACAAVAWLVNSQTRSALTEAAAMNALLRSAKLHSADSSIVVAVCSGLGKFAEQHKTALQMAQPDSGVLAVLQSSLAMHASNEAVAHSACRAVWHLTKSEATDRVGVFDAGLGASLIRVAQLHPTSSEIARCVCDTLSRFALDAELAHRMVNEKGSAVVVMLITSLDQHSQNPRIVTAACATLSHLASPRSNGPLLVAAIPVLVRLLEHHAADWSVCLSVCEALRELAQHSVVCSAVGAESGALETLLRVLTIHELHKNVVSSVVCTLSNLSVDHVSNRVKLVRVGSLDQLRAIETMHPDDGCISPRLRTLIACMERSIEDYEDEQFEEFRG